MKRSGKCGMIRGAMRLARKSYTDHPPSKANAIRERRARVAEKARLQEMAARMSAKKLQRLRKVSRA